MNNTHIYSDHPFWNDSDILLIKFTCINSSSKSNGRCMTITKMDNKLIYEVTICMKGSSFNQYLKKEEVLKKMDEWIETYPFTFVSYDRKSNYLNYKPDVSFPLVISSPRKKLEDVRSPRIF